MKYHKSLIVNILNISLSVSPLLAQQCKVALPSPFENDIIPVIIFSSKFIQSHEIQTIIESNTAEPQKKEGWVYDEEGLLQKHFVLENQDTVLSQRFYYDDEEILYKNIAKQRKPSPSVTIKTIRYDENERLYQVKKQINQDTAALTGYFLYDGKEKYPNAFISKKGSKKWVLVEFRHDAAGKRVSETEKNLVSKVEINRAYDYKNPNGTLVHFNMTTDNRNTWMIDYGYDAQNNLISIAQVGENERITNKYIYASNGVLKEVAVTQNGRTFKKTYQYIFFD